MDELLATSWTHAGNAWPVVGHDRSPLDLLERARVVAETGFTGIGFELVDVEAAMASMPLREIKARLGDLGLRHVELEFLTDWWETGEGTPAAAARRRSMLRCAEGLGARQIKIGGRTVQFGAPVGGEEVEASYGETLRALAAEAADHGTRVAIEFLPFSDIPDIAAARRILDRADHPAAGLCVDVWHIERGASTLDDVRAIPGERVFAVEVDDAGAPVGTDLFADTIHHRRLPGRGDFDLVGFVEAVRATGFDGPWGIEILSESERQRPLRDAVADAFDASAPLFDLPSVS